MAGGDETKSESLLAQGRALAPWFLDVQVTDEISTRNFADAPYPESFGRVVIYGPRDRFASTLDKLYPGGLAGRSVLDCACNCGGFLFWAREAGAGPCYGIDVREHWIEQANFLRANRSAPSDDMRFEVGDLYDLPATGVESFDVVLFNGIFYHLPDPIAAVKVAADLTREVMILNTATAIGLPDGQLAVSEESVSRAISGVHRLAWFPTGPEVVARILAWVGFSEVRVNWWRPGIQPGNGLLEVVAARSREALRDFDAAQAKRPPLRRMVEDSVPPEAMVLVAGPSGTAPVELEGRRTAPFPSDDQQALKDEALIAQLARLRGDGAGFLLVPRDSAAWLAKHGELHRHVRASSRRLAREPDVGVLFSLLPAWRTK